MKSLYVLGITATLFSFDAVAQDQRLAPVEAMVVATNWYGGGTSSVSKMMIHSGDTIKINNTDRQKQFLWFQLTPSDADRNGATNITMDGPGSWASTCYQGSQVCDLLARVENKLSPGSYTIRLHFDDGQVKILAFTAE